MEIVNDQSSALPPLELKRPTTLKDVAAKANVSKMTVSMILSGRPHSERFSPVTRQRVQEAAKELRYHPNAIAKGLTGGRMNTVGVVLSQQFSSLLDDPYVCGLLDGIMAVNTAHHLNTTVFTGHTWSDASHSLPVFCDGRNDGLILISPATTSDVVPALLEAQVPFVLVHYDEPDPRVSSVTVDNVAPMEELVSHLIACGHRRIAFLGGSLSSRSASERLRGYMQAFAKTEIPVDKRLVLSGNYRMEAGYDGAQHLLGFPPSIRPTAMCCASDKVAFGAMNALKEAGLTVPDEMSVTGFDDIPAAETCTPPLTTVHLPMRQMGERAAQVLLEHIQKNAWIGRKDILPSRVVYRDSVSSLT